MSMPSPTPSGGGPRMSRGIKLVLMGVAGAALLYSCTPGIGGGGFPFFLWFLPNLFRGPAVTTPATPPGQTATTPNPDRTAPATTQSQRGGFGSTGGQSGSTGSS